jgi:hypothetical protein
VALEALRGAIALVLQSMEPLQPSDAPHSSHRGRSNHTSVDKKLLALWDASMGTADSSSHAAVIPGDEGSSCQSGSHADVLRFLDALAKPLKAAIENLPSGIALREQAYATDEEALQEAVLQEATLVLCTVSMAGGGAMRRSGKFSTCVVDEAAQLVEAHTAIVLNRWPNLRLLVLVGDQMQLPATVFSQNAKDCGYGVSTFERLVSCGMR